MAGIVYKARLYLEKLFISYLYPEDVVQNFHEFGISSSSMARKAFSAFLLREELSQLIYTVKGFYSSPIAGQNFAAQLYSFS